MSVSKFGRKEQQCEHYPNKHFRARALTVTTDGDYDVKKRKLINVKSPTDNFDCANKIYVITTLGKAIIQIRGDMEEISRKLAEEIRRCNKNISELRRELLKDESNIKV